MNTANTLLARHVAIAAGEQVVHLGCSDGTFGAAALAANADRVILTDRSIVAVESARRALAGTRAGIMPGHGSIPLPPELSADVVAITLPREKHAVRQLLHDAHGLLKRGGRCCIAGANSEGARSAARMLEELFGNAQTLGQGSGHRVVMTVKESDSLPPAAPGDFIGHDDFRELPVTLRERALTLFSRPGVFSWDHLDEATAILADVMEVRAGEAVLDIGCGTGALGTLAALLSDGGRVFMTDADTEAVRCAERTAARAGATNVEVVASDVASAVVDERFDVVVTNPPFHAGNRATDLGLPLRFIEDAWTVLTPGGRLQLVANRTLPYEQPIRTRFGNVSTLHDGPRFKVLGAVKGRS